MDISWTVLAGSNLSGYLRTPTRSIARGSLSSLVFVLTTYALIILCLGGSVERHVLNSQYAPHAPHAPHAHLNRIFHTNAPPRCRILHQSCI